MKAIKHMHYQIKLKAMKKVILTIFNSNIECVLEKNLENNTVPDEQSNNVLIPEANIYHVNNAESKVNDKENNVKLE